MSDYASAIASIESGGAYDLLGPMTRTGDRAYGKYQVMGANVGPWTAQVLGRPLTPQEFMSDPCAQDAVFQTKFGELAAKHGPSGAARAWFAGEGGMNDPGRRDVLGTSVSDYENRFNKAAGIGPLTPGLPKPAASTPTDIASAFTTFTPPLLTLPHSAPLIPPGTAGEDTRQLDQAFEPRWAQRRRTQNPTNRSA